MSTKEAPQPTKATAPNLDVWVRLGWVWMLIFYTFLFLPVIQTWVDTDTSPADRRNMLILVGIAAVWHFAGTILLPSLIPKLRRNRLLTSAVMVGVLICWAFLVRIHPAFYFTLAALYSQNFVLLPVKVAIPGSLIITALVAYLQITENGAPFSFSHPLVLIYALMSVVSILLALWINAIINQSVQRRNLIEQLEQSQSELAAAERLAGVLAERQRLAHEIHDTIAQGFISIITHLEAADQSLPTDTATAQTHLKYAQTTARDSLQQARRVVDNLRPQSLEGRSLPQAIERTAANWSEKTGITVQTTTTGDAYDLHPEVEVTLLRAAQEALNNVRKHASASNVDITLSYMGDVVMLDVQDNGIGVNGDMPQNTAESGGYGLIAMRQRVAQFNGSVTLESDPGEGTTLVVEIPVGKSVE